MDSLVISPSSIMTGSSQQQSLYQLLYGERYIFEEVLGLKFHISPDAFFQINTAGAEVLYQIVGKLSRADKNTVLLDVCCGTGAIGLCLACQAHKVVGVEVVEQAVEDAKWNATFNGVSNCGYHSGKAETVLLQFLMSREDDRLLVAVVNPFRAGLHYRVVQAIQNCEAIRTLIYVSCKPEREAMRNFLEFCCPPDSGKKLVREPSAPLLAVPVDMFPQTMHCELVILFTR
ncbi:tRNA (uracil-5-)-methyltransferase homolog B isoform X1 [Lepidochelys kempii]|uniref:tRNA (uracil-5-)-methyltransferase homolog B isoform X1 n=2 Tax=Lepidochelys kempii TaxID=8472 RepID=UPI003C6F192E